MLWFNNDASIGYAVPAYNSYNLFYISGLNWGIASTAGLSILPCH